MMKKSSGFTLIELIIVLVILGVTVGLAAPNYFVTMERTRTNEAQTNLQAIYMGQKIYALNNSGNYWNPGANPSVATINATLNIDISPQFFPITSITANNFSNPKTFTVMAIRNTLQGGNGTTTFTVNQTGTVT